MGRPQFEISNTMNLVGLKIQLTREILSTWKTVILDSGLCVLKLFLEMRKTGVYGIELIKKR